VGNVAKAHLLAADKLGEEIRAKGPKPAGDVLDYSLPSINLSTDEHRVPTSSARPLGPYVTPVLGAEAIEAAWKDPTQSMEERVTFRTKYDPLTSVNLDKELDSPLQASGQAFYITNGEPIAFWDYVLAVWKEMGHEPTTRIVIPSWLGMYLGSAAEWWAWLTGRKPGFTRERVGYSSRHRWFNIEKARRVLEYEPDVGLVDAIRISAQVRVPLGICSQYCTDCGLSCSGT